MTPELRHPPCEDPGPLDATPEQEAEFQRPTMAVLNARVALATARRQRAETEAKELVDAWRSFNELTNEEATAMLECFAALLLKWETSSAPPGDEADPS